MGASNIVIPLVGGVLQVTVDDLVGMAATPDYLTGDGHMVARSALIPLVSGGLSLTVGDLVGMVVARGGWKRPTDWLEIAEPGPDSFTGLFAVVEAANNFLAMVWEGNYTVDWGDGTAPENVASGVQAEHSYDYATISADTESARGYRQVLVTVTPRAGQHLTSLVFDARHSALPHVTTTRWLDLTLNLPHATSMTIARGSQANLFNVQQVTVLAHGMTDMTGFLSNLVALQNVPLFDTSSVTNFTSMFEACWIIGEIPLFDTSSGTLFTSMFQNASGLFAVPLLDLSVGTSFVNMFLNALCVEALPAFNTSQGVNFNSMCQNMAGLGTAPLLDVSLAADPGGLGSMFAGCNSLGSGVLTGCVQTIDYTDGSMSQAAIVDIFNALGTVADKTITVTGNPGAAGLTAPELAIATDKGWTVVAA